MDGAHLVVRPHIARHEQRDAHLLRAVPVVRAEEPGLRQDAEALARGVRLGVRGRPPEPVRGVRRRGDRGFKFASVVCVGHTHHRPSEQPAQQVPHGAMTAGSYQS